MLQDKLGLKSTVTFVAPGPLGLSLEPVTGDPVRLANAFLFAISPATSPPFASTSSAYGWLKFVRL